MVRQHNTPTSIQVYLGTGEAGKKIRENIEKKLTPRQSISEFVVNLLRKADPTLFKGVENGK